MDHFTSCLLHIRGRLGYEGLDPTWLTRWDKPHVLWKFLLPQELRQWQRSPLSPILAFGIAALLHCLDLLAPLGLAIIACDCILRLLFWHPFCADPGQVLCIVLAIIACAADPRLALGTLDC